VGTGPGAADDGGAKVTAFFLSGGKRILDTTVAEPDLVTGTAASDPILDVAAHANWRHAHHNLYVIELKPEVFTLETKFVEANLGYHGCFLSCGYGYGGRSWRVEAAASFVVLWLNQARTLSHT
jgi:hypothetical protein